MLEGHLPIMSSLEKVVAYASQIADVQNFGWLYDRAKMKRDKYKWGD
jgi:hypothetical protein